MFKIDAKRPCFKFERWAELYYLQKGCQNVERNIVYTLKSRRTSKSLGSFQVDVQFLQIYSAPNPNPRTIKKVVPVEAKNRDVEIQDVMHFYKKMRLMGAVEGEILTTRKIGVKAYEAAKGWNITVRGAKELGRTQICKGSSLDEQIKNIGNDYSTEDICSTIYV